MYKQAAFCLEEVLSMGVLAPLILIRYADVLATLGGAAHLKTARAYYSKALQVSQQQISRRRMTDNSSLCSPVEDVMRYVEPNLEAFFGAYSSRPQ